MKTKSGIKCFDRWQSWVYETTSLSAIKMVSYMLEIMDEKTNVVVFNPEVRSAFSSKYNVSNVSISRSFGYLKKMGVIARLKTGAGVKAYSYILNPLMYWKGSRHDRERMISFCNEADSLK